MKLSILGAVWGVLLTPALCGVTAAEPHRAVEPRDPEVPRSSVRVMPVSSMRSLSPGHTVKNDSGISTIPSKNVSWSGSAKDCDFFVADGCLLRLNRKSGLCWTDKRGNKYCLVPDNEIDRILVSNGFIPWPLADYYRTRIYEGREPIAYFSEPAPNITYNVNINVNPPDKEQVEVLKPNPPARPAQAAPEPQLFKSTLSPHLGGPDSVREAFAVGEDWLKRWDFDKAIENFRRALVGDEQNSATLLALGVTYAAAGEFGKAAEFLRKGLANHPAPEKVSLDAWSMFGSPAVYDGRFQQICAGIAANPKDADLHVVAGFLYFSLEDWARAAEHFGAAEKLDPADIASARMRAISAGKLPPPAQPQP
jgi:tetratricopeptide (TPR) repeat protein